MLSKDLHTHLNSQTLQERHRKVYEELFHACPTVASAPAVTVWSPNYAVGPGGVGIVSKLPMRLIIGIEPTSNGHVVFGPVKYYIPERDEFQDWDATRCNPLLTQVLEQVARQYGKSGGARIWGVSEVPWYRGLNVDPLFAVPCAAAWLLHLGAVSPQELTECVALPTEKLAGTAAFEKVFRLAWRLENIIANWLADGHMTFATLIDSQYPIIFFREKDPVLFDHYRDFGLEHPSSYYNLSDGLFFRGARFNELFQLDPNPAWPIDAALVFTGEEGDSRFVYQTRGAFKAKLDEAAAFAGDTLRKIVPETFRQTPRFLDLAEGSPNQSAGMNLFHIYREISVAHSMTVLKSMRDLFQYGASPEILLNFQHNQNICQHILRILGLSPFALSRPQTIIRIVARKYADLAVATRLVGVGNHGCLMVLGPVNTLAPILAEALPIIAQETKKTAHCHWASWCDGNTAFEGAKVEQHVESKRYSAFVASQSVTVKEWGGNGKVPAVIYTKERFEKEREGFDLLVDEREGRVFVRGKALTSAQIHSAKQTIELFKKFFNGGSEVAAGDLPASCYRSDRNQMESKIVRPLVGAVKELTDKTLGLEIHGGLGSNFKVQFQPDKMVRVGLVEKSN